MKEVEGRCEENDDQEEDKRRFAGIFWSFAQVAESGGLGAEFGSLERSPEACPEAWGAPRGGQRRNGRPKRQQDTPRCAGGGDSIFPGL